LIKAIQTLLPEYNLQTWRFHQIPSGYWNDIENQRYLIKHIEKQLNIKQHEDWYGVTTKSLIRYGAGGLLAMYKGSIVKLLKAIYPEVEWKIWKFRRVRNGYWNDEKHSQEFLLDFAKAHRLTQDEWKCIFICCHNLTFKM
jgi:hypothetical protein